MKRRISVALGLLLASGMVWAQQYLITTVAGRSTVPSGVDARTVWLPASGWVTADAHGGVYFSAGNCVFKVDSAGVLRRIAGSLSAGNSGDGGPAANAPLSTAGGLAVDSAGNLYIVDGGRVRKVSADGVITTVVASGPLDQPQGIAVDGAGNLYIADSENFLIRKVAPNGSMTTVAGNGSIGYSGDGGPATSASLNRPLAVAVDNSGNLYLTDTWNSRIRKVTPGGIITTVAGNGTPADFGDGGPATSAGLYYPGGLAVDAAGNLYIADQGNVIRKVATNGIITRVVGNGIAGYAGDGGPATSAELGGTVPVAVDAAGNLYLADTNNAVIRKVTASGIITTVAGTNSQDIGDGGRATEARLDSAVGVAVGGDGSLYVSDGWNNRVRKVAADGTITTVAGTGAFDYGGDGGPATSAALRSPRGLAVDGAGALYIADGNCLVRKVTSGGTITTVAGVVPSGGGTNCGHSGDGGPATSAGLSGPSDVEVDAAGNLYIADTRNSVVRKVTADGTITTIAGGCCLGNDWSYPTALAQVRHESDRTRDS